MHFCLYSLKTTTTHHVTGSKSSHFNEIYIGEIVEMGDATPRFYITSHHMLLL